MTKKLYKHISFYLIYGWEAFIPIESIVPNMYIMQATWMTNNELLSEWLTRLMELDES